MFIGRSIFTSTKQYGVLADELRLIGGNTKCLRSLGGIG